MLSYEDLTAKVFKKGSPLYNDFLKFSAAIEDAKETLGMSEDEATAFIFEHWKLPSNINIDDCITCLDVLNIKTVEDIDEIIRR